MADYRTSPPYQGGGGENWGEKMRSRTRGFRLNYLQRQLQREKEENNSYGYIYINEYNKWCPSNCLPTPDQCPACLLNSRREKKSSLPLQNAFQLISCSMKYPFSQCKPAVLILFLLSSLSYLMRRSLA